MGKIRDFFLRGAIQTQAKAETAIRERIVEKMDIRKQAKMMLGLTKIAGVVRCRAQFVGGMPDDFREAAAKLDNPTVELLLAPYRAEPKFQELLDKLHLTWSDMEKLAQEALR